MSITITNLINSAKENLAYIISEQDRAEAQPETDLWAATEVVEGEKRAAILDASLKAANVLDNTPKYALGAYKHLSGIEVDRLTDMGSAFLAAKAQLENACTLINRLSSVPAGVVAEVERIAAENPLIGEDGDRFGLAEGYTFRLIEKDSGVTKQFDYAADRQDGFTVFCRLENNKWTAYKAGF